VVVSQAVHLVCIVMNYRIRCKKIELRRQQLGLTRGSQAAKAASARRRTRN
jgi:hypothetical protein